MKLATETTITKLRNLRTFYDRPDVGVALNSMFVRKKDTDLYCIEGAMCLTQSAKGDVRSDPVARSVDSEVAYYLRKAASNILNEKMNYTRPFSWQGLIFIGVPHHRRKSKMQGWIDLAIRLAEDDRAKS